MKAEVTVAIVFGTIGSVLGVVNFVRSLLREKTKIAVVFVPEWASSTEDRTQLGVRVFNAGPFPVSISAIGLGEIGRLPRWCGFGRFRRLSYPDVRDGFPSPEGTPDPPSGSDRASLPFTLDPQQSLRAVWGLGGQALAERRDAVFAFDSAYVITTGGATFCTRMPAETRKAVREGVAR